MSRTRTSSPPLPLLPYGAPFLDEEDLAAVREVLRSDWLTTGPMVSLFEEHFARRVGAAEAVAVSSGTAALHCCMAALDLKPGEEVILPALTFAATANCVLYQGARPVFADVLPDTLLLDPQSVAARMTPATRAIIAVDYAGQPCCYEELQQLAARQQISLVADACHSLGASYGDRPVGSLARLNAFSLHPVKPITCGEGGVVTTGEPELARRMRRFRNHGMNWDHHQRQARGDWSYQVVELGYNYRLTDFQCALALSQLNKLGDFIERRRFIARCYDQAFEKLEAIRPLAVQASVRHAYHLYVIRVRGDRIRGGRDTLFAALRERGIGVNVHYPPVHLHPYYRARLGTQEGLCPEAEKAAREILSLPIFPRMGDEQVQWVAETVHQVVKEYSR